MIANYDISTVYRVAFRRPAEAERLRGLGIDTEAADSVGFQGQYVASDLDTARRYRDKMMAHPRWPGCQWRIEAETTKSYRDIFTKVIV